MFSYEQALFNSGNKLTSCQKDDGSENLASIVRGCFFLTSFCLSVWLGLKYTGKYTEV